MVTRPRLWTFLFVVVCLVLNESAAFGCDNLSGYWENQLYYVANITQNGGGVLGGTMNTSCGALNFDSSVSNINTSTGAFYLRTTSACNVNNPNDPISGSLRATGSTWNNTSNCDDASWSWQYYDANGNAQASTGTFQFIAVPENEDSQAGSWSGLSYLFQAHAVTAITSRHFAGRYFFEDDDNSIGNSETCSGWTGLNPDLIYDSLNKGSINPDGSTGPYPHIGVWQDPTYYATAELNGSSNWTDQVGWGTGGLAQQLAVLFRAFSPAIANGGSNDGYCSFTVHQAVYMITDFGGGIWDYGWYGQNEHVIGAYDSTTALYNASSTTHWTVDSYRGQSGTTLTRRYKFWPALPEPTNVTATVVYSPSLRIDLAWNGSGGDGNGYQVWRSTDHINTYAHADTASTSYQDTSVSANSDYWYCLRATLSVTSPDTPYQGLGTMGPCSSSSPHASTYPQPTSLSINKSTVDHSINECFTMTVGSGAGMTLDTTYTINSVAQTPIIGWPTLDGSGQNTPCTSAGTITGNYVFTGIRNTLNTDGAYVPVNVSLTVQ